MVVDLFVSGAGMQKRHQLLRVYGMQKIHQLRRVYGVSNLQLPQSS